MTVRRILSTPLPVILSEELFVARQAQRTTAVEGSLHLGNSLSLPRWVLLIFTHSHL